MTVIRLCPRCSARVFPGQTHCPIHQPSKASGYRSANWRKVKHEALMRDGHRCIRCGSPHDLTVHLDPSLQGNHYHARLEDTTTLCRSCHGSFHASRAESPRGGGRMARER